MTPELLGVIISAVLALVAAVYAARSGRKSNEVSAAAAEAASNREFQSAFLTTLSAELENANRLNSELRLRLQTAEDTVDLERSRRRDVESKLEQVEEVLGRIERLLALVPGMIDDPNVMTVLALIDQTQAQLGQ